MSLRGKKYFIDRYVIKCTVASYQKPSCMKKEIYVHIPEPCHENWEQMTPVQQGRYCGSCCKQVVDFSQMSDKQVLLYCQKLQAKHAGVSPANS